MLTRAFLFSKAKTGKCSRCGCKGKVSSAPVQMEFEGEFWCWGCHNRWRDANEVAGKILARRRGDMLSFSLSRSELCDLARGPVSLDNLTRMIRLGRTIRLGHDAPSGFEASVKDIATELLILHYRNHPRLSICQSRRYPGTITVRWGRKTLCHFPKEKLSSDFYRLFEARCPGIEIDHSFSAELGNIGIIWARLAGEMLVGAAS